MLVNSEYKYYYVFDKELGRNILCLKIKNNIYKSLFNGKIIKIK